MCRPPACQRRWQGCPHVGARPCQHQGCSLPGSGRAAPGGLPATLRPCCSRGVAPSAGSLQSARLQQLRRLQQRRHFSTRLRCTQRNSTRNTCAVTKGQAALKLSRTVPCTLRRGSASGPDPCVCIVWAGRCAGVVCSASELCLTLQACLVLGVSPVHYLEVYRFMLMILPCLLSNAVPLSLARLVHPVRRAFQSERALSRCVLVPAGGPADGHDRQ